MVQSAIAAALRWLWSYVLLPLWSYVLLPSFHSLALCPPICTHIVPH